MLVYSKCLNTHLTQKLLQIVDSSTLVEDLIDLIGEIDGELQESYDMLSGSCDFSDDCVIVANIEDDKRQLEQEIEDLENTLNEIKSIINNHDGR